MAELVVRGLEVFYGKVQALRGVDLDVHDGEIVAILGPNGAGKTSLLNAVSRLVPYRGTVHLDGRPVRGQPENVVRQGIGHVLEGRHIFVGLTVRDNLLLARYGTVHADFEQRFDAVLDFFPILKDKLNALGGALSGGQQQILAIARGLLTAPKILMMDEVSLGIAPVVMEQLAIKIPYINTEWKTTVVLSEQNLQLALAVADRVYVLQRGRVVHSGPASIDVLGQDLLAHYLGGNEPIPLNS